MHSSVVLLALLAASITADQVPTTIENHPSVVALLRTVDYATQITACGGCILNSRSVLTAARCFQEDGPERWHFRAGSTTWNKDGVVYPVFEIIRHEDWDEWAMMTDIAIARTPSEIAFSPNVQPGRFASHAIPINVKVLTVGWGYNSMPLWNPKEFEDLRQVELTNLPIDVCRPYYSSEGFDLRNTQLCTGFRTVDKNTVSRDKCLGEPGMPLYHGNKIVGIRSYTLGCTNEAAVPSISTRVGSYVKWIQDNA